MSEEIGFGLESGEQSEGVREVSEAEMIRVREDIKSSTNMRAKIVGQSKRDKQNAKLLSLLLQYINDDALLHHVFQQLVQHKVDVHVIVAEFLPYLRQYISIENLKPLYEDVWDAIVKFTPDTDGICNYNRVIYSTFEKPLMSVTSSERVELTALLAKEFGESEEIKDTEGNSVALKMYIADRLK